MKTKRFSSGINQNLGIFLLRLGVGVTFLVHGIGKLSNMEGTIMFFQQIGLGSSLAWLVALIETIGGAMLILGVWTSIPAILLAIVMIGAITTVKWGNPFLGGYELDFVLLMSLLSIAFLGSGKYSSVKSHLCSNCKNCSCYCHPGDKRCGQDGICKDCKCS